MASAHVKELNESSWEEEVVKATRPVLVDFWAPWCGPCKQLSPVIDEIASSHQGKITVCKVNVDDNPGIAAKYGVRGIPTVILFKNGQPTNQVVGAVPKSQIEEMLA